MKGPATILSSIALIGVIILFVLHFRGASQSNSSSHASGISGSAATGKIAYVDIDTFEAHYESLKKKKEEFKIQQESMETELERSADQMKADYNQVMQKQQAGTLTQSEGEAAQKRLGQMQQTLETRRDAMNAQFQEKLESFNKDLHKRMDEFLADYTKEHHFDYVLSYSRSNAVILYADKGLNITDDVIKGMNEREAKNGSAKDSTKGK